MMLTRTASRLSSSRILASPYAVIAGRELHTEKRCAELGIVIGDVVPPVANYRPATRSGNLLFLAGHLPKPADGPMMVGCVGKEFTTDEAARAARIVAINIIGTLKAELGDLDKVKQIVKLTGFVNCTSGFPGHPQVINGASDVLVEVFGDRGIHSRSAVGTNSLPLNVPVEIEAIVEFEE